MKQRDLQLQTCHHKVGRAITKWGTKVKNLI